MSKFEYSLEVYDTHAIICGYLTYDMMKLLLKFCEKNGFTHLVPNHEKPGFKLVRKDDN
jgi:hypothetical protein